MRDKKGPGGRPSIFKKEIGNLIFARMSEGESLRKICTDPKMPSRGTVFYWLNRASEGDSSPEMKEFLNQYAWARDVQADMHAEDLLEIADDDSIDPMRARLMVDTRKWIASKLKPKKYSDRIQQEMSGRVTLGELILASRKNPDEDYENKEGS